MKPAIRVHRLSKRYRLGGRLEQPYQTLRESLVRTVRASLRGRRDRDRQDEFWALRDVSFDVQPGEVVGLIGRNGAGKSTLLKVLSRITEPTSGRAELRGRVGSLLEVGTGFHNELTGRENIYLSGSVLGMGRKEIDRKFDEIVAFAEVDRFLDTPVKRYSSGMFVRLAFAVAAHLDLEILLVDEVLAVGDLDFQKKCLRKMGSIAQGGRTVVFVSHNLGLIHRLCGRVILLNGGQVQQAGAAAEVIQNYLSQGAQHQGKWQRTGRPPADQSVSFLGAWVADADGRSVGVVNCDDSFQVCIEYEVVHPVPSLIVGFQVRNAEGILVFTTIDGDSAEWPDRTRPPGLYRSTCRVPGHLLAPGPYFMTMAAAIIGQQTFETQQDLLSFEISEAGCIRNKLNDRRVGLITPVFDWQISRLGRPT